VKVKLTYFKDNGKYYTEGEYNTKLHALDDIWKEVRVMKKSGRQAGLVDGCTEFIVLVDVPRHPHRHPKLII